MSTQQPFHLDNELSHSTTTITTTTSTTKTPPSLETWDRGVGFHYTSPGPRVHRDERGQGTPKLNFLLIYYWQPPAPKMSMTARFWGFEGFLTAWWPWKRTGMFVSRFWLVSYTTNPENEHVCLFLGFLPFSGHHLGFWPSTPPAVMSKCMTVCHHHPSKRRHIDNAKMTLTTINTSPTCRSLKHLSHLSNLLHLFNTSHTCPPCHKHHHNLTTTSQTPLPPLKHLPPSQTPSPPLKHLPHLSK